MDKNIIQKVAESENLPVRFIEEGLDKGTIVIPLNIQKHNNDKIKPVGIGKGLKTKVNANIGTSPEQVSIEKELEKLRIAIKAGTDTVMDLSTGGDIKKIRREILKNSIVPVGTVPIYQAICETLSKKKTISEMEEEHLFSVIEEQCADGIDFITVHCGVTKKTVNILKKLNRICGVVSRGGAFLVEWIIKTNKENPLYEKFDRLLDIAKKYNVTLSLGDGLRPGAIADACDNVQIGELLVLSELVFEARKKNVQVMVEGPGHMPIDKIAQHVKFQKKVTKDAPFYVLGPLVTDIAPGYDHITSAIGGAIASASGVDFLCYVTPSEHLHLPSVEDVYLGVISARIAAHAGDLAKGIKGAKQLDEKFSRMRKNLNWLMQEKLSIDPEKFRKEREKYKLKNKNVCTMCGEYCAMREMNKVFSSL